MQTVLHRQVNINATKVGLGVVLEFKFNDEFALSDDGDVDTVLEAVLASWEDFSLVELDGLSVDNDTEGSDLHVEITNDNIISDGTASVDGNLFIDSGLLVKGDIAGGPDVSGGTAALPDWGVVSRGKGEAEGDEDDGLHGYEYGFLGIKELIMCL